MATDYLNKVVNLFFELRHFVSYRSDLILQGLQVLRLTISIAELLLLQVIGRLRRRCRHSRKEDGKQN